MMPSGAMADSLPGAPRARARHSCLRRVRRATFAAGRRLNYVDQMDTRAPEAPQAAAERHVTALYQAHALSLARLALLMLGDADAAQDVVQDAFFGLYRRWDKLTSADAAPAYLRASVLNGCRTALRRRSRPTPPVAAESL